MVYENKVVNVALQKLNVKSTDCLCFFILFAIYQLWICRKYSILRILNIS